MWRHGNSVWFSFNVQKYSWNAHGRLVKAFLNTHVLGSSRAFIKKKVYTVGWQYNLFGQKLKKSKLATLDHLLSKTPTKVDYVIPFCCDFLYVFFFFCYLHHCFQVKLISVIQSFLRGWLLTKLQVVPPGVSLNDGSRNQIWDK